MKPPIITIDGPSGSGKGTIGQLLAERLGWHFLDSGALYRVLGMAAQRRGIASDQIPELEALAQNLDLSFKQGKVWFEGGDVSDEIRTEECGNAASKVAAVPEVRRALLDWQRAYAREPGLIADGRDMGSVVFPDAQVKIFLTASSEERALRRYNQLKGKGIDVSLANLTSEIEERDRRDRTRSVSPLQAPAAALELDSTAYSISEVLEKVILKVRETFPKLDV